MKKIDGLNFALSIFSFVLCIAASKGQLQENPNGQYIEYQVPQEYAYQVPQSFVYENTLPQPYWPFPNNVPFGSNIPVYSNVPYYPNVPTLAIPPQYPFPNVYGNIPVGNVPSTGNVPNVYGNTPVGNVPTVGEFPQRRPMLPPVGGSKPKSDDDSERREPLQPNSDGVFDPEVGLREMLRMEPSSSFLFARPVLFNNTDAPWRWWQGPNVCVEKEEKVTENDPPNSRGVLLMLFLANYESCIEDKGKYECIRKERKPTVTKEIKVTYQCCHGSQLMVVDGVSVCIEMDLLNLKETMESLEGGSEFFRLLHHNLEILKDKENNYTVFLPTAEAFDRFLDIMLLTNQVDSFSSGSRSRRDAGKYTTYDLALSHMVADFQDINPGDTFHSIFRNSTLLIKRPYFGQNMMVNCATIKAKIPATNGLIYAIDGVMPPAVKTIEEILKENADFSILYKLLRETGLLAEISSNTNVSWTLFAATNAAFDKTNAKTRKIITDAQGCSRSVLMNSIVQLHLCSSEITDVKRVKNYFGNPLVLTPVIEVNAFNDSNEEITDYVIDTPPVFLMQSIKVMRADILATNGVIHVIDEVYVPDTATTVETVLEKKNLTIFHALIEKSGLDTDELKLANTTLFVPTDDAFATFFQKRSDSLPLKEFLEYDEDKHGEMDPKVKEEVKDLIRHHVVRGVLPSCNFEDNQFLDTLYGPNLRTNLYAIIPMLNVFNKATVDCARIVNFDYKQCGNVIHEIDAPLLFYTGSILDQIRKKENFSLLLLRRILIGTETEKILSEEKDITFLAPTNEAFEALPTSDYDELLTDKEMVDTIFKQHIIKGVICCTALNYQVPRPFATYVRAFNDVQLELRKDKVGDIDIKMCDYIATNGVMHLTNQIMLPRNFKQKNGKSKSNFDIVLYDVPT